MVVDQLTIISKLPPKVKKWIVVTLTMLGVGLGSASKCVGCESGWIDDKSGECIDLDR